MSLEYRRLNDQFLNKTQEALEYTRISRETYGVRIVEADVAPGQTYWEVLGVYHLLPQENSGNHHVYFEVLNESGARIQNPIAWAGFTWEGRRPEEPAPPIALDKPSNEAAGNLAMFSGQKVSVWIRGLSPDASDPSDRVENLHILHPDERGPDGSLGNSIGHHSFYVVFQRARKTDAPAPPPDEGAVPANGVIQGQVVNGYGYTVRLLQGDALIAETKVDASLAFRFEGLADGVYRLEAIGPTLRQDNITLDAGGRQRVVYLSVS